jgi:hypothetical protein
MKNLIISENEKIRIKNLYNITEQSENEKIFGKFLSMAQDITKKKSTNDISNDDSNDDFDFNLDDNEGEKTNYNSTNTGDNWMDVTKKVIQKFEGGYWNPICAKYPNTKHPDKTGMYSRSSETMFGLDRDAGNIENVSSDGRAFFNLIDQEKQKLGQETFCNTWKWNYIPPEPLKSELIDLAAKTMRTLYESNAKKYFKGNTKKVVEGSRPLLLHFSYATWNGPGFFKKFANTINEAVEKGVSIKSMINLAKQDRINKLGGAWANATKKVNTAIDQEAEMDGIS